jgi:hypothetical protein
MYRDQDFSLILSEFRINKCKNNNQSYIYLVNRSAMNKCSIYFPNVTKLTTIGGVYVFDESTITIVNNIMPLSKLANITINNDQVNFLKLLSSKPNCKKLILHSALLFDGAELFSIESSDNFRFVSNTDNITNITIELCRLNEVQLWINLWVWVCSLLYQQTHALP